MKTSATIFILSIIIFSSCKNKSKSDETPYFNKENSKIYTFTLQDSVTKLTFTTPYYLDTTFQWIHRVCGIPYQKIRVQNKKQPIYLENGFYYKNEPKHYTDVTFKQQLLNETLPKMTKEEVIKNHTGDKQDCYESPEARINLNIDTIIQINDNYYSIIGYYFLAEERENIKKQVVKTYFNAGKTYVRATFQNTDTSITNSKFINDCLETIKSINIIYGR